MKILHLIILTFFLNSCLKSDKYFYVEGNTQGTTYHIKYKSDVPGKEIKLKIDSLLNVIDLSMSTYIDNSLISKFNTNKSVEIDDHFKIVYQKSKYINTLSNGSFNPAFGAIFNYYGFGENEKPQLKTNINIDSLIPLLNFNSIHYNKHSNLLFTSSESILLNFNAIAQGYSVDAISNLFNNLNIQHYFIEVGGELITKGVNPSGKLWKVGIETPLQNKTSQNNLQSIIKLNNKALATSGNYRKYYEIDGKKYNHTIDPRTGKPVTHNLLSATVVSNNCALSDALATTFMVWGEEKTKSFLKANKSLNLGVYLISDDTLTSNKYKEFVTDNLKDYFQTY